MSYYCSHPDFWCQQLQNAISHRHTEEDNRIKYSHDWGLREPAAYLWAIAVSQLLILLPNEFKRGCDAAFISSREVVGIYPLHHQGFARPWEKFWTDIFPLRDWHGCLCIIALFLCLKIQSFSKVSSLLVQRGGVISPRADRGAALTMNSCI